MKKTNSVLTIIARYVASLALLIGVSTITATASGWIHQPKVPEGMEKFKK